MVRMTTTTSAAAVVLAHALVLTPSVDAGPCGYGALCGRNACDGATMAAYNAALPAILACENYAKPFYEKGRIKDDEAGRAWCFGGACGAAFDTIVKFYDIERSVCEIHYPERKEDVISGHIYAIDCLILSESLPAGFRAERDARVAKARSAIGAPTAPTTTVPTTTPPTTTPPTTTPPTTAPPTTAPTTTAPTTTAPPPPTTPPPTTAAPTTTAPAPTATPGPSVVAFQNVTQNTTGSASSASSGADTSESSVVVSPPPTSKTAPAPVPSSAKPTTSSATTQYGAVGAAVAVALLLAVN